MKDNMLVSIIVCSRNEEKYIGNCIKSLVSQKNINGNYEILAVDGMSEDKTREIIHNLTAQYPGTIKFFENTLRVKPPAINIGFRNAKGRYIAICDAHTVYDENYISSLVNLIEDKPEVVCVGGPIISIGETEFGKATAMAMSSYIGVGNPKHRFSDYEGYAEMACFPLFKREVFDLIGHYDERFIINHDDEYCYRMRKAGGKIYLSPIAKSYYNVRNSPGKLFYQYYTYGLWQIATIKKHRIPIAIRQLIPATFYVLVTFFLLLGLIINSLLMAIFIPVVYLTVLLISSIPVALKNNFKIGFFFPVSVLILHFSYAVGFLWGFAKFHKFDT